MVILMEKQLNKSNVNTNFLMFMLFSLISLLYFTFGQKFVPFYFKWDENTVKAAMNGNDGGYFGNAANFYTFFGFHSNTRELYFQLFSWIIYLIALFTIFRINKGKILQVKQLILIIQFTFLFGIYFACPSKDLILVVFTILAINLFLSTRNYYLILLIIYLYSRYYRNYWLIVVELFLITLIFNKKKFKTYWIPFLTMVMIIYYNFVIGDFITNYRLGANAGGTANSMIFNYMPNSSIFTDIINYLYVLISMIIPIQGFGSFNQLFYYACVWFIIYLVYSNKKYLYLNVRIMYLVLIYFNVQACYEPDFGSALRHMMGLFLFIYLFLFDGKNDEKSW